SYCDRGNPVSLIDCGPRIKEKHFHIKDHKSDRIEIILNIELDPCSSCGNRTRFICRVLACCLAPRTQMLYHKHCHWWHNKCHKKKYGDWYVTINYSRH